MDTKEKILEAALFLFNRFGFTNVRLRHIADELSISTGNLAYHYRSKDEIIETLYGQIRQEQDEMMSVLHKTPILINIDRFFEQVYLQQARYSFFYTDTLEVLRAYPGIKSGHRAHVQWYQIQLELLLQFNVARGAFREPSPPDSLQQLAYRWRILLDSWMNVERTKGTPVNDIAVGLFKDVLWALLGSHFTQDGREEYYQLGKMPFDSLG